MPHVGLFAPFVSYLFLVSHVILQTFDVPLVIQLTDDEKFLWKDLKQEECMRLVSCDQWECLLKIL